jgi:hypothetical protein
MLSGPELGEMLVIVGVAASVGSVKATKARRANIIAGR